MLSCLCAFPQPFLPELCQAVSTGNKSLADGWRSRDCWITVEQLVRASGGEKS